MNSGHIEDFSTNQPITAHSGGAVAQATITGEKVKGWLTSVILAISIMVNVFCLWTIRDVGTRKWLHDYDLNQFQMGEFRQLQREVDLDHALLQQQCKR